MSTKVSELVRYFDNVNRDRMHGLSICNPRLEVEAVGFRNFEGHQLGVLITPWFMNLILLPQEGRQFDSTPGSVIDWNLPGGQHEFTACRDEALGTYFTAVLFRSVTDFPDQTTAREIAQEVLVQLFTNAKVNVAKRTMSRRALFTRVSAG